MNTQSVTRISVREATAFDAEVLAALQAEMDDKPDDEVPSSNCNNAAMMREVLLDMTQYPHFRAYLATDANGVAVGTFSLMIFCSPSHQGARQALLDAVVVSAARRGEGIGQAMLAEAMQLASGAGCYKMMLSSNLKRVDAHRFYERLGFNQHGISFSIPLKQ